MDDYNPQQELGPTPSLPTTVVPLRKSAPASIKRLILELGLRYHPSGQDALEAHKAKLAALAADCSHLPPEQLDRAIREWAQKSPYLPKASELIDLCRSYINVPVDYQIRQLEEHVQKMNGYRWVQDSGVLYFVAKRPRTDGTDEHYVDRAPAA